MSDLSEITYKRYIHLVTGEILLGNVVTARFLEGQRMPLPDEYIIVKGIMKCEDAALVPFLKNPNLTEIGINKCTVVTTYPAG